MSVSTEFNTVKELVKHVLNDYPNTRNNDTELYVQCCRELGAKTIDDIVDKGLSIISIHKVRQLIQNKEKLFLPDNRVKIAREERSEEVREYMRNYI